MIIVKYIIEVEVIYLVADFKIVCKIHDSREVITQVGVQEGDTTYAYNVIDIVNRILDKKHRYYTDKRGSLVWVYAKKHPYSGRWFLTTKPDSARENNLDFLPKCVLR